MPTSAIHKARDLPPNLVQALGQLLGRQLKPEEHVSVMAYEPHKAPSGPERAELLDRLNERIDKTATKLKDVPQTELDQLIDEAVDHVRHHRP